MTVVIVRLGLGNIASVRHALERQGVTPLLSDDPETIAQAERLILPGVGAAAPAMAALHAGGLVPVLTAFRRPLLGLCLGHQLLFEESSEGGRVPGLGLLPGRVERLTPTSAEPVPNMGWCRLGLVRPDRLLAGIEEGAYVYFVHSYACPVNETTIATARHATPFTAIARGVAPGRTHVHGCQFHPERSGDAGARLIANFLNLPT